MLLLGVLMLVFLEAARAAGKPVRTGQRDRGNERN